MNGVVVIDTNLLLLLVVGTASRDYISIHRRLGEYTPDHFDLLGELISRFSDIVLLPHILVETSNLLYQAKFKNPARKEAWAAFRRLMEMCVELPVQSVAGARRAEFERLGLTDAVLLHFCEMEMGGLTPTLVTADTVLADAAHSLGYGVIDYGREYLAS